nr:MAG TPA: hypothetical protein [Caudoviricetes sp.]
MPESIHSSTAEILNLYCRPIRTNGILLFSLIHFLIVIVLTPKYLAICSVDNHISFSCPILSLPTFLLFPVCSVFLNTEISDF